MNQGLDIVIIVHLSFSPFVNYIYREFLNGFSSEQNIKILCGVYRGICEGYAKAFSVGALDNIVLETRASAKIGGMMAQAIEFGGIFYINWY